MFFRKKKSDKVILNCYTHLANVYEYASIQKASKALPKYFHDLPKYKDIDAPFTDTMMNLRGCTGFTNLYTNGFYIPLWSDLALEVGAIGDEFLNTMFAHDRSNGISHGPEQRGSWLPESEYQHFKLDSPWLFQCDDDINWHWNGMPWNNDHLSDYVVYPAVVNYSKMVTSNINMIVSRGEHVKRFVLPLGTPMAQLIPMTEREVEVRQHLISEEEWNNLFNRDQALSFNNIFAKRQSQKRKCPFAAKFKL